MFKIIASKKSKLVLSYSNTGMIDLNAIMDLAISIFGKNYKVYTKALDYQHSTMGRLDDKSREVKEFLIIAKPI